MLSPQALRPSLTPTAMSFKSDTESASGTTPSEEGAAGRASSFAPTSTPTGGATGSSVPEVVTGASARGATGAAAVGAGETKERVVPRSDGDYESDDEESAMDPLFRPHDRDRIFESLTEEPTDKKKGDSAPPPQRACPMCHGMTLVAIPVVPASSPAGSPQRVILPKQ